MATLALLAWHVAESMSIRPSYLAYFNQLAGGPSQGYLHLADSSLDWGQDLPSLKQWLDGERLQRGGENAYLSYFGTARPRVRRHPGDAARRLHRSSPAAASGSARRRRLLRQRHHARRREPSLLQAGVRSNYQAAVKNAAVFARASEDEQAMSSLMRETGEEYWRQLFGDLDQLRTGRLLAFLRERRPDAMVGYSILIYRLTDADVAQALNAPLSASR